MKFRLWSVPLFAIILVVAACDGSMYPLSESDNSRIESNLVGTWRTQDGGWGDTVEESLLSIIPFNDHEYFAIGWAPGEEDEASPLGIFTTEVNGVLFATVSCLGCEEEDGKYFFFKYEMNSPEELVVVGLNDDEYDEIRLLGSTSEVHRYVSANMGRLGFFDSEIVVYQKSEDLSWPW